MTPIPTSTPTTAPPTPTPTATVPVSEERQITSGMVTSQNAVSTTLQLRQYAVDAVYLASQVAGTGNAVTTGTVTIVDANNATYDPTPTDRLRINFPDGRFLEEVVTEIAGGGSSAGSFFNNNHRLNVRVITGPAVQAPDPSLPLPLNTDVQIFSAMGNGQTQLTVAGVTEQDGVAYTLDLTSAGTFYFDSSFGGLETRSNFTVAGTVTGGALALTVDERYINQRVVVDGDSASLADTEIRNQWTYNGANFQVVDGLIRRSFRNGYVNENELDSRWTAQGAILRNGAAIGGLNLLIGPLYVDVIVTADGQSHTFQSFRRYTNIVP
ncbi:MAG: hypothetical protein R2873_22610 [Caldilineaceae bacterium]